MLPPSTQGSATQTAMNALIAGQDVGAAVYGKESTSSNVPEMDEGDEDNSSSFGGDDTGQDTANNESSSSDNDAQDQNNSPDVEEIFLTENGQRRKMKLSWNDPKSREAIKRQIQMAGGMRKFQSERDQLLTQKKELETKYNEMSQVLEAMETSFKTQGVRGVINLVGGSPDAYENHLKEQMERAERYRSATPEQREFLQMQEQLNAERAEKNRILQEVRTETEKASKERESADRASAEAAVHPVFDKYRFAGKLGNAQAEQQFDEAIWSRAIQNIQNIPEAELTAARIDKEFRTVSATFSKLLKDQAVKSADTIVAKKKETAKEAVSAAAIKNMKGAVTSESIRDRIRNGGGVSALKDILMGKGSL